MPSHLSRAGAAGVLVAAAVLLVACTPGPAPTPTPTPPPPSGDGVLRIGTLFATHGADPALAVSQTAAVNAAVRDIAAAGGFGGVPLEVFSRDAGTAEDSFAQLVAHGVDVVIGPPDAETAAALVPLARDAGVALVSSSATGARPEGSEGVLFRTAASARSQGAAIAEELGEGGIALVRGDDPASRELAAGLGEGLADIVLGDDVAATAAQVAAADPGSVVVAVASAPLLAALGASGIGADRLWLTAGALTGYDETAGTLAGAHGIQAGVGTDPAFAAGLQREDPAARATRFAAEAYDAVVLVALAALAAGDDGGPSIAASLPAVAGGGIPCRSFGECVDVRADGQDIDYEGMSGPFGFDAEGDRDAVSLLRYAYDAGNQPQVQM